MNNGTKQSAEQARQLGDFLREEVYPRLTPDQVFTHDAHQWHKSNGKWQGGCPWHKSKSGTSFYVETDSLLWRCPACQIGGGPVEYLHRLGGGNGSPRGKGFVDLVRRLAEMAGVEFPELELTEDQRERMRKREARCAILETAVAHCEGVLWSGAGEAARAYLHTRGFTDDAIRDLRLGLYDSAAKVGRALEAKGYSRQDAKDSAVVLRRMEGYITFPWHDDAGRLLTIYGTWQDKTPPEGTPKKMALPNPGGRTDPWEHTKHSAYLYDRARRAGHKELVLVEGITDAAVAHAHGDNRVIACVGAELSRGQVETLARHKVALVTICLDPDKAGENGISSCVRQLIAAGITPYVAPQLPDGLDPDDFILRHGIDAWKAHVAGAVHAYRHVARQLVAAHKPADGWTDRTQDAAVAAAVAYAAEQPAERREEVERHLLAEVSAGTGASLDGLRERAGGQKKGTPAASLNGHASGPATDLTSAAANGGAGGEPPNAADQSVAGALHLTDLGNARRLVERHGHDLRYCHPWKTWLVWDDRLWAEDTTAEAVRRVKDTQGEFYRRAAEQLQAAVGFGDEGRRAELARLADTLKHALRWEDAKRVANCLELARSEPGVPVLPAQLDANPFLLNCANGTLDLRTGRLREHRQEDYITKLCPVAYDPGAACPLWEHFLARILSNNVDLIDYLQRVAGYCLTGDVSEQCLWFLYGTGANGKSTFLLTLLAMLGDGYSIQAVSDLLMVKKHDAHPTERADLFGIRLAATIETEEGTRVAEALMKQVTGGDKIRARKMRQDFFQFSPTHKIFLAANHKPVVRGTDHAVWRRIKLVPFTVTIPDTEKDKQLPEKLKAELPGILAWAVRGCLAWQEFGLAEPEEVRQATSAYQAEQDSVHGFLEDRCCRLLEARVKASVLLEAYLEWSGDRLMTPQAFRQRLNDKGFKSKRGHGGAYYYRGVGLIPEGQEDDPEGDFG
jgi:putative DNA primase/helicase